MWLEITMHGLLCTTLDYIAHVQQLSNTMYNKNQVRDIWRFVIRAGIRVITTMKLSSWTCREQAKPAVNPILIWSKALCSQILSFTFLSMKELGLLLPSPLMGGGGGATRTNAVWAEPWVNKRPLENREYHLEILEYIPPKGRGSNKMFLKTAHPGIKGHFQRPAFLFQNSISLYTRR